MNFAHVFLIQLCSVGCYQCCLCAFNSLFVCVCVCVRLCVLVCVKPTQVVVVHHGIGASEARALLGEMISKLEQRGVFLQHIGYLHLHLVA